MPFDPGPPGWSEITDPDSDYPSLEQNTVADFAVVGAGFAGLAAARRLQQLEPNCRTILLEARNIGDGPCGRNSGFMIDIPHNLGARDYVGQLELDRKDVALNREGIQFASDAAEEYSMSIDAFEVCGKVNAAATESGLRSNTAFARHLSQLGESHEVLDEKQMHEICGSRYYLGGVGTPGNPMIKPGLYIKSFARGVAAKGVDVFVNSPVTGYSKTGGSWKLTTPGGDVEAKRVILAVNGHIESFGFFRRRLMHFYLYASLTRCLTFDEVKKLGGTPSWGFTPADHFGSTVRRITGAGGDRILIRNGIAWAPGRDVSADKLGGMKKMHARFLARRFPELADVRLEYTWGGLLCLSQNSVPAFGELDEGLYAACCQNGLGTSKGTLHGKLIAELACGYRSSSLETVLQMAQPKKLPPEPFASIGANFVTRWGEYKAGKER